MMMNLDGDRKWINLTMLNEKRQAAPLGAAR